MFRPPRLIDLEQMYNILEGSLGRFLVINERSSLNNRLIIDKGIVEDYITDDRYYTIVAEINSQIVGWMSGSSRSEILCEHGCYQGEFYLEEIVVDSGFRRKSIGKLLINKIPENNFKAIIVDTLLINEQAVRFYERAGFVRLAGMSRDFSENWIRLAKTF